MSKGSFVKIYWVCICGLLTKYGTTRRVTVSKRVRRGIDYTGVCVWWGDGGSGDGVSRVKKEEFRTWLPTQDTKGPLKRTAS